MKFKVMDCLFLKYKMINFLNSILLIKNEINVVEIFFEFFWFYNGIFILFMLYIIGDLIFVEFFEILGRIIL